MQPQTIEGSEPQRLPPEPMSIIQELGLTQDQFEQVAAIRNQYRNQISETSKALGQAEETLDKLMASPTATEDEVREQFLQLESLRQKLSELTFESRLKMRSVLEPEQRRAFLERF